MTLIPSTNKIQYGLEAAYHDGAADTIEPVGITNFQLTPKVEVMQVPDLQADTFVHEAMVTRRWSEGIIEGWMDYERFFCYLDGFFGFATPGGTVRTYLGSNDWIDEVPKSLSIRYGQTGALFSVYGAIPYSLNLVFDEGTVKYSYPFFGGAIANGASFQTIGVDVPDWAMANTTALFLDAGIGATVGTTPITDIMFRAEVDLSCNRRPVWHLGDQVWDSIISGKWAGTLKLVLEADGTNLTHLGNILDATGTPQYFAVRLRSTDGNNVFDLDFCGVAITPPILLTDLDGIVTLELNLDLHYNTTLTSCVGAEIDIAV